MKEFALTSSSLYGTYTLSEGEKITIISTNAFLEPNTVTDIKL